MSSFSSSPRRHESEDKTPIITSFAEGRRDPKTAIRYDLPQTSDVVLKIYNVLGQEVRTLVNGKQSAGEKSVVWDGKDRYGHLVSSGVYIYRIEAGEHLKTRKMLFLK